MFDPNDIRIDSYHNAAPGAEYHLKITHLPSGIYTSKHTDKSYFRARKKAEEELIKLLDERHG